MLMMTALRPLQSTLLTLRAGAGICMRLGGDTSGSPTWTPCKARPGTSIAQPACLQACSHISLGSHQLLSIQQ